MPSLSESQLKSAAAEFLEASAPESITAGIAASEADRSKHCREAQNALRSAIESADSALATGAVMNRIAKVSEGKRVQGGWATPAQDSLRASVLFAGAGLDRALKRLADDALPLLVQFDSEVNKKLSTFATDAITEGGSVDPKQLVALLIGEGSSPRDTLVRSWSYVLSSSSAQSAERVSEFAGALGITDKDLRTRVNPTKHKSSKLEKAFVARNEIAHELDVTDPEAESRKRLERIRRARSVTSVRGFVTEMLDVTQQMVNDVAIRLETNGHV